METDVPRCRCLARIHPGRLVRHQLAVLYPEDKDPIQTFVGYHDETTVGVERNLMRMRAHLFDLVRTRIAGQLRETTEGAERSIQVDRQYG